MAVLKKADLLNRDNIKNFSDRVNNKGDFRIKSIDGDLVKCTGRFKINDGSVIDGLKEIFLSTWLEARQSRDKLLIEVKNKQRLIFENYTSFYKDKEFGGQAPKAGGQGTERQETGLINLINEQALINNNMTIKTFSDRIIIKGAEKKYGRSPIGKEPYIDIIIEADNGTKYGISCKGPQAPSLAGGGIGGLKVVVPDLAPKVYTVVENYIKRNLKLSQGDIVDFDAVGDVYIEMPNKYVKVILEGIPKMGGPITHMYVGPMDVTGTLSSNKLTLNGGSFYSISEYMKIIPNFYFRLRKRDLNSERSGKMKIEFNEKNSDGFPKLFKGLTNNKNLARIVVIDEPSNTAKSKGAVLKI